MPNFERCTGYLATDNYQWFPVVYTGQIETVDGPLGADFVSALGGRTVFDRGQSPREWKVSAQAPYKWVKNVQALAKAGVKRFYWLSPLGAHVNALVNDRPRSSDAQPVGLRSVDGEPVETFTPSVSWCRGNGVPIQPGATLHGSAFQQGGTLLFRFHGADGESLGDFGHTSAPGTFGLTQTTVTAPDNAYFAYLISDAAQMVGRYSIRYETHGMAEPATSACAYVTLHDVQIGHENIAYAGSPISLSFTLKEVA